MNKLEVWEKLGNILKPSSSSSWLKTWAGASCSVPTEDSSIVRVYVTGKDDINRSRIGSFLLNLNDLSIVDMTKEPVIALGERGSLDENGTSYPMVLIDNGIYYMYYLGWIKGVHVPWYNGLFLATSQDGVHFSKYSEAPIFDRNREDPLGIGSVHVCKENDSYTMWYSRFDHWGENDQDHKHYYNIKQTISKTPEEWSGSKNISINFLDDYAIAKPSIHKINDTYFMWYSYRGDAYSIGFAYSYDGKTWNRRDELVGIYRSQIGWDSEMQCYAHVFEANDCLYMLYNGNAYGATGLGLAKVEKREFISIMKAHGISV